MKDKVVWKVKEKETKEKNRQEKRKKYTGKCIQGLLFENDLKITP